MKAKLLLVRKIFLLLLFFVQVIWNATADNRGGFSNASPGAPSLSMGPSGITGGGGPGGVAFLNTAILNPDLTINTLTLDYNPAQPDGSRMVLSINGKQVGYNLYDWEMIPVARFANSPYVACFTYFGELIDKTLENTVLDHEGHVLNYHADFFNTLMGYRLADMDLLLLYDFTTDLPRDNQNQYFLGAGEKVPDVTSNTKGLYNYLNYLDSVKNELGYVFRSYVIGDFYQDISIQVKNDSLKLSGNPYYYCWKFKQDFPGYDIQETGDSITGWYQSTLQKKRLENPDFSERGFYIDSLISLSETYPDRYQFYESGTFTELVNIESRASKRIFLERYTTSSLKEMVITTATYMDAFTAVYLKAFSDRMSGRPQMLAAINPAVWHATVTTMRTAAFFRFVMEKFPAEWQKFLNKVKLVQPVPVAKTPTVMYKTGNAVIEQALRDYFAVSTPLAVNPREIILFPNPVDDVLTIQNLQENDHISIYSLTGEKVIDRVSPGRQIRIFTGDIAPGTYVLQIRQKNQAVLTRKIIRTDGK